MSIQVLTSNEINEIGAAVSMGDAITYGGGAGAAFGILMTNTMTGAAYGGALGGALGFSFGAGYAAGTYLYKRFFQ